jgi:hypothetical protein
MDGVQVAQELREQGNALYKKGKLNQGRFSLCLDEPEHQFHHSTYNVAADDNNTESRVIQQSKSTRKLLVSPRKMTTCHGPTCRLRTSRSAITVDPSRVDCGRLRSPVLMIGLTAPAPLLQRNKSWHLAWSNPISIPDSSIPQENGWIACASAKLFPRRN